VVSVSTRTYVQFRLNGEPITAELPSHLVDSPGTEIDLLVDMSRVMLFDPASEKVIGA